MIPVEVTVTCGSQEEAESIGRAAVERRLAACAQSWPISSCYRWNESVVNDSEHVLLLKTIETNFEAICELVKELHSYELPAIVLTPTLATGPGYAEWLEAGSTA